MVTLVVTAIFFGSVTFTLLIVAVFSLGTFELAGILSIHKRMKRVTALLPGLSLILCTCLIVTKILLPFWIFIPGLLLVTAIFIHTITGKNLRGSEIRLYLLSFFWLALPLTLFFSLGWIENRDEYHYCLPLAIMSLSWVNDAFAYLSGTLFGKHRMTPALSPGKTWEGFAGGLVTSLLTGWIIYLITDSYHVLTWIFVAVCAAVFGLAGDLFESKIKRTRRVKNSGNLLPGHGGILDRFDSLLFIAPAVFIIFVILNGIS